MTRRREPHRGPRRARLAAVLALAAGLTTAAALSACSSGQITQTGSQVAAVPGANGNAGPAGSVALRNGLIPYDGVSGYPKGGDAPIAVRIFNDGLTPATLVGVSAEGFAAKVLLVSGAKGPKPVPTTVAPTSAVASPSGSPAASGAPKSATPSASASPTPPPAPAPAPAATKISIIIGPSGYALLIPEQATYLQLTGLTQNLTPGMSVPVTFTFADGTKAVLGLPVGPATAAVPRGSAPVAPVGE